MTQPVRVRFAPSPTGTLHLGGARTAVYNWAFARKEDGVFILRIDDTDPERSTAENTAQILRSLTWLGLDWDEGPDAGGDHGPYFQTQRSQGYEAALAEMKANGSAYPCFCTPEELEAKREAARASGSGISGYDRTCRALTAEKTAARIAAGDPHVWRLAVPLDRGPVVVDDAVRGLTEFPIEAMDDFVLARTDGTPTYNFATVVDDADMEITHVIRGDDHLTNTPRQILVFEALGRSVPRYAHLSMIWGPDGKKLSKRHGATSVEAYAEMGYLPEALVNYLALLGWSLDGETTIVPPEKLTETFTLDRISKNPAIFDADKLEWMNGVYIREMPAEEFVERAIPWLVDGGLATQPELASQSDWLLRLTPLVVERVKRFDELAPMVRFLFEMPPMEESALHKALGKEGAGTALGAAMEALESAEWTVAAIEEGLRALPDATGLKSKVVFQAVRAAVTGSLVSLPLFESLELLGKQETMSRIGNAHRLATP